MLKQLLSEQEAIEEARKIINSVLSKRWMIVTWCIDESVEKDKPNLLRLAGKTTWQFPTEDYGKAIRLLQTRVEEESKEEGQAVPAPLEMASFLLDGDDGDDGDDEDGVQPDGGAGLGELLQRKREEGE